jgi:hypothetical protein
VYQGVFSWDVLKWVLGALGGFALVVFLLTYFHLEPGGAAVPGLPDFFDF